MEMCAITRAVSPVMAFHKSLRIHSFPITCACQNSRVSFMSAVLYFDCSISGKWFFKSTTTHISHVSCYLTKYWYSGYFCFNQRIWKYLHFVVLSCRTVILVFLNKKVEIICIIWTTRHQNPFLGSFDMYFFIVH